MNFLANLCQRQAQIGDLNKKLQRSLESTGNAEGDSKNFKVQKSADNTSLYSSRPHPKR